MHKILAEYSIIFRDYLISLGWHPHFASLVNTLLKLGVVAVLLSVVHYISKKVITSTFEKISQNTKTTFDNYLVKSNFPRFISQIIPWVVLWQLAPYIFISSVTLTAFFLGALQVYLIILFIFIMRSILRTLHNYLAEKERFKDKPMESYVQVLMIFTWGIGLFWIVQLITGYSASILATFGAASAVVLLIFKDTILGFVASIQISVNDIVRIGDWITFNKFGADGFVTEINLATVRVQNWDKTYTTIPTYNLIADSFQNWRGMEESGGRRIKRSIYIKQSTIKFLSDEDIEKFKKIERVKDYLDHRQTDIDKFNKSNNVNKEIQINGRNQTNLGVFRYYVNSFISSNTALRKDYSLMVRQMAPTDKGLPLEIYCFSKDIRWANYEHIQADIFDHVLAALPYFDLEVFESPTGSDVQSLQVE